jgi:hypothetical protein
MREISLGTLFIAAFFCLIGLGLWFAWKDRDAKEGAIEDSGVVLSFVTAIYLGAFGWWLLPAPLSDLFFWIFAVAAGIAIVVGGFLFG